MLTMAESSDLRHRRTRSPRQKRLADGSEPFAPPGVFERLGIEMTNAIVRNARAKLVERWFEDVKNYISPTVPDLHRWQCGREAEPPKGRFEAREHIPTDAEVIAAVDTLIEGYMNCDDYGGSVAEDKGKSRIQVWHEPAQRRGPPPRQ